MTQIKKDSKIIIKVQKLGVLLGSGDISLFQSINSKEKVINKWVNLSRTDIKKSAMMSNTVNNIMKINLKISISYIGNFNSTQCNDDSPSKKELVTKIKNPNKNNIITKNKKVNLSSKRTNSVNNNNSLLTIDYKNKSMVEPDSAKHSLHYQNKQKNKNLDFNNINDNMSVSGI